MARTEGPRGSRAEERDEVVRLTDLVFRGSADAVPSMQDHFPLLLGPGNLENMRVILEDGQVVSHLGIKGNEIWIHGARIKAASIGSVCTHPEHQGKGYATILLEDGFEHIHKRGGDLVLISGARGLYRRADCHPAGRYYQVAVGPEDLKGKCAPEVTLRVAEKNDITALATCYRREPVRFRRPVEDFAVFLAALQRRRPGLELILCDGEMVGYLAHSVHKGKAEPWQGRVIEYAGSRAAVLAALGSLMEREELESVEFMVPAHDTETRMMLGVTGDVRPLPHHTLKVLDFGRMMKGLAPYIEDCLGASVSFDAVNGTFRFQSGSGTHEVRGHGELLQFLFGEVERPSPWSEVFPLDLPEPGLNYV